MDTKKKLS